MFPFQFRFRGSQSGGIAVLQRCHRTSHEPWIISRSDVFDCGSGNLNRSMCQTLRLSSVPVRSEISCMCAERIGGQDLRSSFDVIPVHLPQDIWPFGDRQCRPGGSTQIHSATSQFRPGRPVQQNGARLGQAFADGYRHRCTVLDRSMATQEQFPTAALQHSRRRKSFDFPIFEVYSKGLNKSGTGCACVVKVDPFRCRVPARISRLRRARMGVTH